ncbi:Uncharacterised protein [uncultured archaeon]|nr:Uncharacterised protein [uncultured archaeon]
MHFLTYEEEFERARQVHEKWKTDRPINFPKAIRYVREFRYGEDKDIPSEWSDFSDKFALQKKIRLLCYLGPVGWNEKYLNWLNVDEITKLDISRGIFSEDCAKFLCNGIKSEIKNLDGELNPISLIYSLEGTTEKKGKEKILIFYDNTLVAKIKLENDYFCCGEPCADYIVDFMHGPRIKEFFGPYDSKLGQFKERDIRKIMGEDINSFELVSFT